MLCYVYISDHCCSQCGRFITPNKVNSKIAYIPDSRYDHLCKNVTVTVCSALGSTGQEFRALFISTSEPTKANGETRDSTKSISDPHVFITAITRARSLVVAVGNPFMLLKREEHMVKKYGDRGYCWSLFLKACLDNNSISCAFDWDDSKIKLLTEQVHQRISHLHLMPSYMLHSAEEAKPFSSPFNNHFLKKTLGKGGFGVVYVIKHMIDDREYALKIVEMPDE